jgi:nucleotide-binding universal stress UspA family protein
MIKVLPYRLIIDSKETFTHYDENPPTKFIREMLVNVECPVLLVPPKYKPIKKIALLYDGEPSSVYAIKMFSYLFPTFKDIEVEVISVNEVHQSLHLTDNKFVKEYMKRHFPKASFTVLKGLAEIEIVRYLKNLKDNCLIVSGAYRRGMVSRWFRQSMADVLMKELKQPLFVAHNK